MGRPCWGWGWGWRWGYNTRGGHHWARGSSYGSCHGGQMGPGWWCHDRYMGGDLAQVGMGAAGGLLRCLVGLVRWALA